MCSAIHAIQFKPQMNSPLFLSAWRPPSCGTCSPGRARWRRRTRPRRPGCRSPTLGPPRTRRCRGGAGTARGGTSRKRWLRGGRREKREEYLFRFNPRWLKAWLFVCLYTARTPCVLTTEMPIYMHGERGALTQGFSLSFLSSMGGEGRVMGKSLIRGLPSPPSSHPPPMEHL